MKIDELFEDVLTEDRQYEFKAILNQENPLHWAKSIVGFANGNGGMLFVGVSDNRDAFGLDLTSIDKTKNLVSLINDRHIFPHAKISYLMRNVDDDAEKFILVIKVAPSDSVVRYREGDYNEKVFIKGDGLTTAATPEDIISLSKRKRGIDNETTEIPYEPAQWSKYLELCKHYRMDQSVPELKEMQNEDIISANGYAKSGFVMFKDDYENDDTLVCCRLWKGETKTGIVLDSDRFKGSLSDVFENTLTFIERNTKSGWKKTGNGGREVVRSYPKEAVREALVNAIAHRDYSIGGTQIDVDIYDDRMDIVSPGSWLLPRKYDEYPVGTIPSIRRNTIIAACLDIANLMERGGTGFQTIVGSYKDASEDKQPGVLIYPGFLDMRLYDLLYNNHHDYSENLTVKEKAEIFLRDGGKTTKELQTLFGYNSRSSFIRDIINPLLNEGVIYRDGNPKSRNTLIKLRNG